MSESKLAKVLRWLIYAVALVPLIIFSQFISPFHFGKIIVFRSLVEITLVFYLLLVWRDRSYWVRWDRITWAFFLFSIAFTLTTFTSVNVYQSFWGTLERMGGLWTFWHYFVYFVILTSVFRKKEDWFNLLKLIIVVGILSAFYGFGQKTEADFFIGSGNRARIFGTIGNAALFAGYQLLILFLSLTLLFKQGNTRNEKWLYVSGTLFTVIAVLMTAVRGSILALGVSLFLFFLLRMMLLNSKQAKKVVLLLGVLVVLFVGFTLVFKDSNVVKNSGYLNRLTDFSLNTFTVQTRFWAWQAGIDGWNDSFKSIILGWGPENFNVPFSIHFNPGFFSRPGAETLFDRGHNMFVEVLVTMGILGLAAYLWLFSVTFSALRRMLKENSDKLFYGVGLIPLIIAYIIHNSFIFDTSANFIAFFTILGFISFLNENTTNLYTNTANIKKPKNTIFNLAGVFMFIAVAVLIYQTNIIPTKANYATTRAIIRGWEKDFNGAIEKFKEAVAYENFGKYEIRHRFAQFVLDFVSSGKITSEREEVIKFVIKEVEKNAAESRLDYLPYLYLSRLNIVLGKDDPASPHNDIALGHVSRALEISPTFVRAYYEIAQVYLNKKDYVEAANWFEKAANLNPGTGISYWYWGLTELEAGNTEKGIELVNTAFSKNYGASENDLARLLNAYVKVDYLPGIVDAFERLIIINPKKAQYHASLAAGYVRLGRIDDAVAQAREAVKIDPAFEAEARAFVKQLGREL